MGKRKNRIEVEVIAYSGYKADERPLFFIKGKEKREIHGIKKRWRGEEHDYFKVIADDELMYLLRLHRASGTWSLEGG